MISITNFLVGLLLAVGLIAGLFIGKPYIATLKIPSNYTECLNLNYGKHDGYRCNWNIGIPVEEKCSNSGCFDVIKLNFKFNDCFEKGGVITKVPKTGNPQVLCTLSYFKDNFKVPGDFDECKKLPNNSLVTASNTERLCQISFQKSGAFDNPGNTNSIDRIMSDCEQNGGMITSSDIAGVTLEIPNLVENPEIRIIEGRIENSECNLIYSSVTRSDED